MKSYFNQMSFGKRASLISTKGNYVAKRNYYNQRIALYAIGKIFVEATYEPESNTLVKIEEVNFEVLNKFYLPHLEI